MTDKFVVLTTCGSQEEAERLAGCVNIIPGTRSIYRWEDKIEATTEFVLIIKSRREVFPRLRETIAQLHSYEISEVIALPVADGSDAYLNWLDRELGS